MLIAKQFTSSVNKLGIKPFSDVNTAWHFDDKVGQKYLLESIGAPLIPIRVFYSMKEVLKWADLTSFHKVFKLRVREGSINIRLGKNKRQANRLIKKAFSGGFLNFSHIASYKDRIHRFNRNRNFQNLVHVLNGILRFFVFTEEEQMSNSEKGYIYFQNIIPDNDFNARPVVVGNKCLGF